MNDLLSFESFQTSLLCIVGELAGGGSHSEAAVRPKNCERKKAYKAGIFMVIESHRVFRWIGNHIVPHFDLV